MPKQGQPTDLGTVLRGDILPLEGLLGAHQNPTLLRLSFFVLLFFFIYSLSSIQHGHEWGIAGTPGSKIGKAVLGSSLVALIKVPPTSSPLLGICVVPARV